MFSLFGSELFRYRLGRVFDGRISLRHLLRAGVGGQIYSIRDGRLLQGSLMILHTLIMMQ